MLTIGNYQLRNNVIAAPMAGVTDLCFRRLCHKLGAGMVVGEMVSSDPRLWQSRKSMMRTQHDAESSPKAVQIAGSEPDIMAQAAQYNVSKGAELIDINMGCPAKKVCKKAAGSALLADEELVKRILDKVVSAVDVPVTLKIRTGTDPEHRNGLIIAKLAEQAGIAALAVHGRTRADKYLGQAEYDTIKIIKANVSIPVIANGDIDSPDKAKEVLEYTNADGIMIGRAAQGNPWIFQAIDHYLTTKTYRDPPSNHEIQATMLQHLDDLYHLYGNQLGAFVARKHIGWYCQKHFAQGNLYKQFNQLVLPKEQCQFILDHFS